MQTVFAVIVAVRVPNLLDYAETNEDYSIRITFGDGHVFWLQPFEETYDSRIYASGSDFDVMGDVDHEKGIIWGLVHMPDTVAFEWETIDTFEMEAPKRQRGVEDYTFARADIEAPVEEVPNLHELTEFRIDRSAISLKAKDNGDGTLTFTYRDSSMKPYYSYPWSWFEQVESVYMNFGCLVGGKLDYDPDSTEVAIGSSFAFNRRVGEFDYDYNLWHQMTIDMREALMLEDPMEIYWMERGASGFYKPDGFSVIVDESGLSATWTQAFEPGYTFDDIAAFQVILSYQIFNEENEAVLFSAEEDSEQSFGFEIEEVME